MDHRRRVYESVFEMLPDEENPAPLVRLGALAVSDEFLAPDGTFKPADELRAIYLDGAKVDPELPTIAYCRIGERSSHTRFVLRYLLGLEEVANYDGSWTEYGNVIGLPIER